MSKTSKARKPSANRPRQRLLAPVSCYADRMRELHRLALQLQDEATCGRIKAHQDGNTSGALRYHADEMILRAFNNSMSA